MNIAGDETELSKQENREEEEKWKEKDQVIGKQEEAEHRGDLRVVD